MLKLKPLEIHYYVGMKTELLRSRKLPSTIHVLSAIVHLKFPAVVLILCTCASFQLVTDDYVIMDRCTRVRQMLNLVCMQSKDAQNV